MRRFEFSLERVLRHKERAERQAELKQSQALAHLRGVDAEVAAIRRRLDETAAGLEAKVGNKLDLAAWLANYRMAERLQRELSAAQQRRAAALHALQEAAGQRKKKALEAEAIRHLRHRRKEQHDSAAAKAEQVALDEISLRRWLGAGEEGNKS